MWLDVALPAALIAERRSPWPGIGARLLPVLLPCRILGIRRTLPLAMGRPKRILLRIVSSALHADEEQLVSQPDPDTAWSGDGFAVDLAGATLGAGRCGLGRGEPEPLIKGPRPARGGTWVAGAERHHLHHARAGHEPPHRLRHQGPADAPPARARRPPASARDRPGAWR
jgi:hypothetical protein